MGETNYLEFEYNNYKGEEHNYVIRPLTTDFPGALRFHYEYVPAPGAEPYTGWTITGLLVGKDGKKIDDYRPRTFKVTELKDLREISEEQAKKELK